MAIAVGFPSASQTSPDPASLCLGAARNASERQAVPLNVLLTIAMMESGRQDAGEVRPWPWTVNQAGEGRWFDTKDLAHDYVQSAIMQGVTNIDIGCFQLNYRWHAENFGSLEDMLDPEMNADYAAGFLARLYQSTGSWSAAAASYHSRTQDLADTYRTKFDILLASLGSGDAQGSLDEAPVRENRFPLLMAGSIGAIGSFGSIVPQTRGASPLFGAP